MARKKIKTVAATLPGAGDTSLDAVAKRLTAIRETVRQSEYGRQPITKIANCTAAEWRRWQSGKELIPRRNAWFIALHTRKRHCDYWYPVEWIFTGKFTDRPIPSPMPRLDDDLSGFAARVREARESFGLTLDDIREATQNGFIYFTHWQAFEAGLDEPNLRQLEQLVEGLEVDAEWLYGAGNASPRRASVAPKQWPASFKPMLDECWDVEGGPALESRVTSALSAAGVLKSDAKRLFNNIRDGGQLTAVALLCGVPLESLIFEERELTILRRRVDRFKRRLGIAPPRKRRSSAA